MRERPSAPPTLARSRDRRICAGGTDANESGDAGHVGATRALRSDGGKPSRDRLPVLLEPAASGPRSIATATSRGVTRALLREVLRSAAVLETEKIVRWNQENVLLRSHRGAAQARTGVPLERANHGTRLAEALARRRGAFAGVVAT